MIFLSFRYKKEREAPKHRSTPPHCKVNYLFSHFQMSSNNIENEVRQAVKDLMHIRLRVVPIKVGKEVVSSVRQNFRSGGFYGDQWKRTKRQDVPFKGASGSYGPLLSKSTHLMSSTDYVPGNAQVTIRNTESYAAYHNEGAEARVTRQDEEILLGEIL